MQVSIVKRGAAASLGSLLEKYDNLRIFLVRGKNSYSASGAEEAVKPILNKYILTEFYSFSPNPKLNEAEEGFKLFLKSKSNLILCIGGGSVIDTGKIIKYLYYKENFSEETKKTLPLITIPTTAGTGSEATRFSVVYINGKKCSYDEDCLLPDAALVDANLLKGQSKYQMAVSGIDAFAQGIESYWNINSTDESRSYAEKAIKLMWENLHDAINGNPGAEEKISEGSNYSGKAINITRTTAPHALSYGFTSKLNLPHGHAVALFLPFFIHYHKNLNEHNSTDSRGADFTKERINDLAAMLNVKTEKIEIKVADFFRKAGVEINFNSLNISEENYFEMLKGLNLERLKNNPGKISKSIFKDIYRFNNGI